MKKEICNLINLKNIRSRNACLNINISLEFGTRIGSTVADTPVKFKINRRSLNVSLYDSCLRYRLCVQAVKYFSHKQSVSRLWFDY